MNPPLPPQKPSSGLPQPIDRLIAARWILPVVPQDTCLEDHAVAVDQGRILAVLPTREASARYAPRERVDLDHHVLIPGLVNAHAHGAMNLLRGHADDLPLLRWLRERIWPAEAEHLSESFVHTGTLLAAREMLRGGVTAVNDMYFFPEAAGRAYLEAGLRATVGMIVIDFPTRYGAGPDDYLARGLATRDRFRGEPSLRFSLAPHAPYSVADAALARVAALAEELDLPIHTHLHETRDEIAEHLALHGCRPLERLRRLGLVSSRLTAAHAVHLEETEIGLLALHGASVVHCPASNLKLASGIAPTTRLIEAGINVALGTDGAASNNRLDLLSEMRLAALLAKGASGDAQSWNAHASLRAATLAGARALGLEAQIGSIEPGKAADLTAVNLSAEELMPCHDPAAQLAYCAGREHVEAVWVGGEPRVWAGQLVAKAPAGLAAAVCMWQNRLVSSKGN